MQLTLNICAKPVKALLPEFSLASLCSVWSADSSMGPKINEQQKLAPERFNIICDHFYRGASIEASDL